MIAAALALASGAGARGEHTITANNDEHFLPEVFPSSAICPGDEFKLQSRTKRASDPSKRSGWSPTRTHVYEVR